MTTPTAPPVMTDAEFEQASLCLDRAKITILTRSVFLASISFELNHIIAYIPGIDTAATDGLSVVYNPKFFLGLSKDEQVGLVAHEIWHVAFDHIGRILERDPKDWNYAGDYVINAMLLGAGYTLPKGGLYNPKWGNMATDDVYEIIHRDKPPQPEGGIGLDVKAPGALTPGHKGQTAAEVSAATQKIAGILSKAQTASDMAGKAAGEIPGEVRRQVETLLYPQIPWHEYLQRFLSDIVKNDYTWKRPNNRFMPDFYLPSQGTPTVGNITIAVDTSGSITAKQLQEIYSEIENIRVTFSPPVLTLIGCDRKIQKPIIQLYEHDDIRDIKLGGGGGTSFRPVLDYCDKHQPQALLYFTDLEGEHITDEPDYPTLWICYSKHRDQGIGETIRYRPADRPA